jgi:HPt (histidine-containing phosphotransfer) domain-containing protein
VPIIALTASVMPGETAQCLAAGMNAQLAKPIDPVTLAATLSRLASRAAAPDPASPRPAEPLPGRSGEPVVDEKHMRILVDALGPETVRKLIAGVPDDADGYRARLAEACMRGDLSGARAAAHGLKGIAANLGLTALAELAGAMENACVAGNTDRLISLSTELDACLDQALARLQALALE